MFDPLELLPHMPGGLAMLGGLVYLWVRRRRSPRAVGLATAGLVGGLLLHFGQRAVMPAVYAHISDTGGLFGVPPPAAYYVAATVQQVLLCGCLLLVIGAVVADRRPRPEEG